MSTAEPADLALLLGGWQQSTGPLAARLGDRLVSLVDDGLLPAGTRLPTERALAETLRISRSTATAGYRRARDAGRIEGRQGAGTWVRGPGTRPPDAAPGHAPAARAAAGPASAFDSLGRSAHGVIDLSLAETRCDVHTRTLLAERTAADPEWVLQLVRGTGYHPQGLPALRAVVAEHLTGCRIGTGPVGPDDVLVTTGAQQAIALAANALATPGSTVLVEEATYPGALQAFRAAGLRALPVPGDERGPDPDALADLVARVRPALAYLVPVGNNPTGVVIPGERLDRLAEVFARSGVLLLEDRSAVLLADPARVPAPLSARLPAGSGCVTIGSTSKVAWAGLRIGWAAAPRHLLRELVAARLTADLAGSLVSQRLGLEVVPALPRLAAAVRADVAEGQRALGAALADLLPGWTGQEPQAGAWRWVRVPGADARTLARAAADRGVLVTPGPAFSPVGALADRVRIAAVAPPHLLVEGVRRLRGAWDAAGGAPAVEDGGRDLLLI